MVILDPGAVRASKSMKVQHKMVDKMKVHVMTVCEEGGACGWDCWGLQSVQDYESAA